MTENKMTQSLEDYLKTIGLLAERGEVRITDIAVRLGVSKPSVPTRCQVNLENLAGAFLSRHKQGPAVDMITGNIKKIYLQALKQSNNALLVSLLRGFAVSLALVFLLPAMVVYKIPYKMKDTPNNGFPQPFHRAENPPKSTFFSPLSS
jgi:hypothetical protein